MEHKLTPELFDRTHDSHWWRAKRGKPPIHVILGIWLIDVPSALSVGLITGLVVFFMLLLPGQWIGLIGNDESSPAFVAIPLVSPGVGLAVSLRFLRHAVRTTRLFLLLRNLPDSEFERTLQEHEEMAANQHDTNRKVRQ